MATHLSTTVLVAASVTLMRPRVGADQVAPKSGALLPSSSKRDPWRESVNSQRTAGKGFRPQLAETGWLFRSRQSGTLGASGVPGFKGKFWASRLSGWVTSKA